MPNVIPTKNNLMNTKKTLRLAEVGYDLLDRKRSILVREITRRMERAKEIQRDIAIAYSEAYYALGRATVAGGLCDRASRTTPTDNSLSIEFRSVMGAQLPSVTLGDPKINFYYALGLTSSQLDEAYLKFNEVKRLTAEYAELECGIFRLADAVKKTQKRTNALKNIMIPQLEATAKTITEAIEEKEREEFSRLKVIKNK